MNIRKIFSITLCLLMVVSSTLALSSCTSTSTTSSSGDFAATDAQITVDSNYSNSPSNYVATNKIEIKIKDKGTIAVDLYGNLAPITVKNFLKLINDKFYDGLTFHRIISGFMIQGGDPLGNGTGGSKDVIKGEFSANGIQNYLSHERGVISMARANAYDSASSQFFIMHQSTPSLDGQYAAFGRVTSGLDVVDELAKTPVTDGNGTVERANQPIIEYIKEVK